MDLGGAAWDALSDILDELEQDGHGNADRQRLVFQAAGGVTFTLTAGYVSWLLRAGYLSASLLTSLPLWREFDPLPILGKPDDKKPRKRRPGDAPQEAAPQDAISAEERFFEAENP
jgi:hypothetical protein